jgi:tetratricopeptide (TPR) repeat protein
MVRIDISLFNPFIKNWYIIVIILIFFIGYYINQSFILTLTAGIISTIIILLLKSRLSNYQNTKKAINTYLELNKKIKDINPAIDLRIAEYHGYYHERSEENEISNNINLNKNILIIGKPKMGKTRTSYEVIKEKKDFKLIKFWEKSINLGEIPNNFFKKKTIVFLDDLNNFSKKLIIYELIKKLRENEESFIIATCRDGEEYRKIKEEFPEIDYVFKIIEMKELDNNIGLEIAENLNLEFDKKKFDGSPGSLIFGQSMKNRYNSKPIECKILFRKLKLLHEAGINSPPILILKKIYFSHIKERNINVNLDFEDALQKLKDNSLISINVKKEEVIKIWHDSYFDFDENHFNKDDFKELQTILIKTKYVEGLYSLGNTFYFNKLYNDSIGIYEKVLEINENYINAWTNKGAGLTELGRFEEAIICYENALKLDKNFAIAYNNKGVTLSKIGKFLEAKSCFEKAIDINPYYFEALNNRGTALSELNNNEMALESFENAININPDYGLAWHNKGLTLKKIGKFKESIESYQKSVQINPENAEWWYELGKILLNLKKFKGSIKSFDKVLEINPNDAVTLYNKGIALLNINKYEEAFKSLNTASKIKSNDAETWNGIGVALFNLDEYYEALESYDKALEIDPNYLSALYNKGIVLTIIGKYKEAIEIYDKALKIDKYNINVWYGKINTYEQWTKSKYIINLFDNEK